MKLGFYSRLYRVQHVVVVGAEGLPLDRLDWLLGALALGVPPEGAIAPSSLLGTVGLDRRASWAGRRRACRRPWPRAWWRGRSEGPESSSSPGSPPRLSSLSSSASSTTRQKLENKLSLSQHKAVK